jgi:hypothetical protein
METLNLTAKETLTFIPSGRNYRKAIEFYLELGFQLVLVSFTCQTHHIFIFATSTFDLN